MVFTPVVMESCDGSISSYILGRVSITSDSVSYSNVLYLLLPHTVQEAEKWSDPD